MSDIISITKNDAGNYRWAILDCAEPTMGAPSGNASNIASALDAAAKSAIQEGLTGEIFVEYQTAATTEYVGKEVINRAAKQAPAIKTVLDGWTFDRAQKVAEAVTA